MSKMTAMEEQGIIVDDWHLTDDDIDQARYEQEAYEGRGKEETSEEASARLLEMLEREGRGHLFS